MELLPDAPRRHCVLQVAREGRQRLEFAINVEVASGKEQSVRRYALHVQLTPGLVAQMHVLQQHHAFAIWVIPARAAVSARLAPAEVTKPLPARPRAPIVEAASTRQQ